MKKQFVIAVCALLLAASTAAAENKKIVVTGQFIPLIAELQKASPDATLVAAATPKETLQQIADADAIFGTISPELLKASKKLKWVQVFSAGVETYMFPDFVNSDIVLTNCKIVQGPNIADHAMALLLSLSRSLNETIPRRTEEAWLRRSEERRVGKECRL